MQVVTRLVGLNWILTFRYRIITILRRCATQMLVRIQIFQSYLDTFLGHFSKQGSESGFKQCLGGILKGKV